MNEQQGTDGVAVRAAVFDDEAAVQALIEACEKADIENRLPDDVARALAIVHGYVPASAARGSRVALRVEPRRRAGGPIVPMTCVSTLEDRMHCVTHDAAWPLGQKRCDSETE